MYNAYTQMNWCLPRCVHSNCIRIHHKLQYDILYIHWNQFLSFQQSFTSNWPKTMWFAVDQRGVHLLEFRTKNVLTSYEYDSILDYTPSLNHMLLITGSDKKQSKIIVTTNQVLINDQNHVEITMFN